MHLLKRVIDSVICYYKSFKKYYMNEIFKLKLYQD